MAAARGQFRTLNVDMIFNLPNQTRAVLDDDLKALLDLRVDQISFYPLMTATSARRRMDATVGHADPSRRHDYYARILEAMATDYRASSAWCFSRRNAAIAMIDEYIVDHDDYVGVGSGAFSYVDGWMYAATFSLNQYRLRIAEGRSAITQGKRLTPRERMRYDILVRLFGLALPYDYVQRKLEIRAP